MDSFPLVPQSSAELIRQLNHQEILDETLQQIQKDLASFQVEVQFPILQPPVYPALHKTLVDALAYLFRKTNTQLIALLYRIDISEKDIAQTTADMPHYSQLEVVAHQVILRELKKVLSRKFYKS